MNDFNAKFSKQFILLFPILFALILCGCQNSESPALPVSPFSDSTWEYTVKDVTSYEGSSLETYDSIYGGICYTYPKTYQERQGTIKYMFDDEERLMCIAWTCSADEEQELYDLYDLIEQSVNSQAGETGRSSNTGCVWYREDGNIILSLMITSDLKALQYAYLHPDVSNPPKE